MIAYPPTPTQLDSIYLRLAAAYRRQQARRAAYLSGSEGEPQPLTIAALTPPAGQRGPYRPRTQRKPSGLARQANVYD